MDPDPAISSLTLNLKMPRNTNLKKISAYYFLKVRLHHFSKIKSQKKSQNSRNKSFAYYFCMMIEGSGSGSGSIPLINGSGSGSERSKNMWIRWILIRNTAIWSSFLRNSRQESILFYIYGSRMFCKKNLKTWREIYWGLDLSFISRIFVIHISWHSPRKEDGPRAAGDAALVRGSEHRCALSASQPRGSRGRRGKWPNFFSL